MRKIVNGELVTQFRFTGPEVTEILKAHLEANGEALPEPDFGEGEGDFVGVEVRYADNNLLKSPIGAGENLVLVFREREDDPVVVDAE